MSDLQMCNLRFDTRAATVTIDSPLKGYTLTFPLGETGVPPAQWKSPPPSLGYVYDALSEYETQGVGIGRSYEASQTLLAKAADEIIKNSKRFDKLTEFEISLNIAGTLSFICQAALPLRRYAPEMMMRPMSSGPHSGKTTKAYPLYDKDLLKRAWVMRASPHEAAHSGCMIICTKANLDDMSTSVCNRGIPVQEHPRHVMIHNVHQHLVGQRNLEGINNPQAVFPNDRAEVLEYYSRNPIAAHIVPTHQSPVYLQHTANHRIVSAQAPLDALSQIMLKDMKCPKRHQGCFLYCRVLTSPKVAHDLAVVVEDTNGHAIALSVENAFDLPSMFANPRQVSAMYPIGSVLSVSEPTVHISLGTGIAEIIVVNPCDIKIHPNMSPEAWRYSSPIPCEVPLSAAQYKDAGNAHYAAGKLITADRQYTLGLALLSDARQYGPVTTSLLLNRAWVYLKMKRFGPALADLVHLEEMAAGDVGFLSDFQQKRLHVRKLEALYGLRLWQLAQQSLQHCEYLQVSATTLTTYRKDLRQRMREEQGDFDWASIRRLATAKETVIAEYYGPIAIANISGKGRGLIASRDVKAGELLMVETPVIAASHDLPAGSTARIGDQKIEDGRKQYLDIRTKICHTLFTDPSKHVTLSALDPGHTRHDPRLSECERVEAICNGVKDLDVDLIRQRRNLNGSSLGSTLDESHYIHTLYAMISLINHDCLPTACVEEVGLTQIIRARKNLKKGEEITVNYNDKMRYHEKLYRFQSNWGFTCLCELCVLDSMDDAPLRQQLMEEEWSLIGANFVAALHALESFPRSTMSRYDEGAIAAYWAFVDKIASTYAPNRRSHRYDLATVMVIASAGVMTGRQLQQTFEEVIENFIRLMGNEMCSAAQQASTGRMVSQISHWGDMRALILPMLRLARLLSNRSVHSGPADRTTARQKSSRWLRTALWTYTIFKGKADAWKTMRQTFAMDLSFFDGEIKLLD